MSINLQIKEPLESKLNKAFNKLAKKNKFISNDKNKFVLTLLDTAIDDLYKSKTISQCFSTILKCLDTINLKQFL